MKHLQHTIKEFEKVAKEQEEKGISKYGKPLNPLDDYDWLEMADQEAVDLYKYFQAEKVKRKFIVNKIRKLTDDTEIHFWLDQLEGKR